MLQTLLYTDRLVLRPLEPADAPLLRDYVEENKEWLQPWEPDRTSFYYSNEAQRQILFQALEDRLNGTGLLLGLFLRHGPPELIGRVSIFGIVRGIWQNCFIGYSLGQAYAGQGLMTEAMRRVIHYCFADLDLHRIQLSILPRNQASHNLARRLNFRHEGLALRYMEVGGRWEDHDIMALTMEEVDAHYFRHPSATP